MALSAWCLGGAFVCTLMENAGLRGIILQTSELVTFRHICFEFWTEWPESGEFPVVNTTLMSKQPNGHGYERRRQESNGTRSDPSSRYTWRRMSTRKLMWLLHKGIQCGGDSEAGVAHIPASLPGSRSRDLAQQGVLTDGFQWVQGSQASGRKGGGLGRQLACQGPSLSVGQFLWIGG